MCVKPKAVPLACEIIGQASPPRTRLERHLREVVSRGPRDDPFQPNWRTPTEHIQADVTASSAVYRLIQVTDIDPLTKLVAFPAFEQILAEYLMLKPMADQAVCLAIGDVDGLKRHVEQTNASDPAYFGHLAGNRVMAKLGQVTRALAADRLGEACWWCAATFGGDEVILLADVGQETFQELMLDLRNRLASELPTSVSFAYGRQLHPGPLAMEQACAVGLHLLASIDRALFSLKRRACELGEVPRGELLELRLGSLE